MIEGINGGNQVICILHVLIGGGGGVMLSCSENLDHLHHRTFYCFLKNKIFWTI